LVIRRRNRIMFGTEDGRIKGWTRTHAPQRLMQDYPCIMARGERAIFISHEPLYYDINLPDEVFSAHLKRDICHSGDEIVFTWGIDCKGKLFK